jgi:hypothetical protein
MNAITRCHVDPDEINVTRLHYKCETEQHENWENGDLYVRVTLVDLDTHLEVGRGLLEYKHGYGPEENPWRLVELR